MVFGSSNLVLAQSNTAKPEKVNFCDLMKAPERYVDQLVQTEASYISWWESEYLYSERCVKDDLKIWPTSDCDESDEKCLQASSSEWKKLNGFMSKADGPAGASRVRGVFVGRIQGPDSFGHLGWSKWAFRVRTISNPSRIDKKVPWDGL